MVRITDIVTAEGMGGFFYDDQVAVGSGVASDGFLYSGQPVTVGFDAIRTPARTLSLGLVLSNGSVAWGDMMSVQYAGAAGRYGVFRPADAASVVEEIIRPRVVGMPLGTFRSACEVALAPDEATILTSAVQYGSSQAFLRAVSMAQRRTMTEVICEEFELPLVAQAVPLYAQSGDSREINIDKMILKRVQVLPQGLINSAEKFGPDGLKFLELVKWLTRRIQHLAGDDYNPVLHFDVYGWIGRSYDLHVERIADFIERAQACAAPFRLNIEHPADFGCRERQIEGFRLLRDLLRRRGCPVKIVVDEWCNNLADTEAFAAAAACDIAQIKMPDVGSLVDAVLCALACRAHGVGVFIGGSCTETDISAQVSAHVAVALQADMVLAKPGMGVDEGISIVGNEQRRLVALLRRSDSRRLP